jgi:anti-anti-sigma factor
MLDLRDLTFMDSFGLHLITAANDRAQLAGRRLVLLPGPQQVQRLLAVTGAADSLELAELGDIEPATRVLLQTARG